MIFRYPSKNTRANNLTVSKLGFDYFYKNKKMCLAVAPPLPYLTLAD